jgi:hypothetical protein
MATADLALSKTKMGKSTRATLRSNFTAKPASPPAPTASQTEPASQTPGKVILKLQTREHLITVFSGGTGLRYSVATDSGIQLAENLSDADLKDRFPDLHDIIKGTAWAGM